MSKPLEAAQYVDSKGTIIKGFDGKIVFAAGTTVPTDAAAGYSPGCIFLDTNASAGSQFFINEGSATSCDFNALSQSASSFANSTLTGNTSITGDTTLAANSDFHTNGTNGSMFGTASTNKVGFWGATPIVQPAGAALAVGMAGGGANSSAAAVYVLNTTNFNGNLGSAGYNVSDIVRALKSAGILAS